MKRARVIVSTDNESIAQQLAERLACERCAVYVKTTLAGCTDALKQGAVDVLVLDLLMSNGTGFGLYMACRKNGSELPIVTYTHSPGGKAQVRLRNTGIEENWAQVPVDPMTIQARVMECLTDAESIR